MYLPVLCSQNNIERLSWKGSRGEALPVHVPARDMLQNRMLRLS